jgi:hypothetical protein
MTPPSGGAFSKGENMKAKIIQHYKSAFPGGAKVKEYAVGDIVEGEVAEHFIKKGVAALADEEQKQEIEDTFEIVEEKPKRRRTRKSKKEE